MGTHDMTHHSVQRAGVFQHHRADAPSSVDGRVRRGRRGRVVFVRRSGDRHGRDTWARRARWARWPAGPAARGDPFAEAVDDERRASRRRSRR